MMIMQVMILVSEAISDEVLMLREECILPG